MSKRTMLEVGLVTLLLAVGVPVLAGSLPMAKPKHGAKRSIVKYTLAARKKLPFPSVKELGVPLYPDLAATVVDVNPDSSGKKWGTVTFMSQAKTAKVIAWYRKKKLPGWKYNTTFKWLEGKGCTQAKAITHACPMIAGMDVQGACPGIYECKSEILITYPVK